MKTYRITACCDPYNARHHYNNQKVVRYDGTTPIEWIMEDGFASLDEAKAALMRLAKTGLPYEGCDWFYYDDEAVRQYAEEIKAEDPDDFPEGVEPDMSWFHGAGIYAIGGCGQPHPVLLEGERSFTDDSVTYFVEEA